MVWSFDLRTAILVGALGTWLTGGLLLASWRSLPASVHPSLRWWLAGLGLHPLAFVLIASRGWVDSLLSIALAGTLLAAALACLAIALRSFYGLPERRWRLAVVTALMALVAVWFGDATPGQPARIMLMHLLLAVVVGSGARAVFRRDGPSGRVPRLTGLLFAAVTALALVRAAAEWWVPSPLPAVLAPTPLNLVCLGSLLGLPVLATTGFLLMCTERSQVQLEHIARMDYLTGIFNRRAIEDLAARAISASHRHGGPLAVVVVDVDHFKHVNDEFGHECGDQVLVEAVRRMRAIMRSEDLLGRLGGEEFVVVMPDIDVERAQAAAERLRSAFAQQVLSVHSGERSAQLRLSLSVGVAMLQPGDLHFSPLLRRADRAMYAAKAAGRNRVVVDVPAA